MKSLSEICIRRSVLAWMIMAGLIIFGLISYSKLGVSLLPDVNNPVVGISLNYNGASPEVIEGQVVDLIEDAVMGIQGIRQVSSKSRDSSGTISVEFEIDKDIDVAVQEIRTKIAQIQNQLPADLEAVSIKKTNPEDQPILWLTVTSDGSIPRNELMMYTRDVLFDQFATVAGVGDISLGGYVEANLRVWPSLLKLDKYKLAVSDILQAIKTEHIELPSGRIENKLNEKNVRILGETHNPEEFGKIVINQRAGGSNYVPITLNKVARVEEGIADIRRYSRYNGQFTVGLGILKQHGSNAVEVADNVRKKVDHLNETLPKGISLAVRLDNTRFIKDSVHELVFILFLSAFFTSLVCYLFLGSWTSTINVLLAIPTSIIGAFTVLYFFGFTLNTFTLLGLSLAIGIVVDDAIMMLENIVRHREKGETKRNAALLGSKEITFAATAATIAVVAIFIPVIFMNGVIGRYFFQYGVTMAAAVLLSLLEALTLTPMRCSRYLEMTEKAERKGPTAWVDSLMIFFQKKYSSSLKIILNHKKKILFASLLFFVSSLSLMRFIPSELMPAQDQSMFMLRVKTSVGSSIIHTDKKFKEIENYLSKVPEISGFMSTVGGGGGEMVNEGQIFVALKPKSERKLSQAQIAEQVRHDLKSLSKGLKVSIQDLSLRGFGGGRGYPLELTIVGPDWEKLGNLTEEVMTAIEDSEIATDLDSDFKTGMPEIKIIPDREKLAQKGIALSAVTSTINSLVGGAVLNSTVRYSPFKKKEEENDSIHRYDIRVRLEEDERVNPEQLKKIKIRNNRGEMVALSEVAHLEEGESLQVIMRENRERSITLYGNIAEGHSQGEVLKKAQEIAKKILPNGYSTRTHGSAKNFKESLQGLLIALFLGIFVSYMVLASQFNSFLHPVTVLLALPFSISGACLALLLTHQTFNIYSIIGLILLMGIVKKNSILLVDFTNHMRSTGLSPDEALIHACPVRLRPILMTSLATIVGAIPSALSLGPGSESRIPMAIAIIGGVLLSTFLTLFVIPAAYSFLVKFERS